MTTDNNNSVIDCIASFNCSSICAVLRHHPFIGAGIIDYDGKILWANERDKQIHLGTAVTDYQDKNLADFFPHELVEERLALLRRVCDTGKPAHFRQIRFGKAVVTTYHKLPEVQGQTPRVLIMASDASSAMPIGNPEDYIQFDTEFVCLGPLDKLSNRELEVLVLLSQGLTTVEIADRLDRSPKTVEAHRSTISRKLRAKNRIQLAEIAHRAMLEIRHTKLKRIAG